MALQPITSAWNSLLRLGTAHLCRRDAILFDQGYPADAVYAVEDGQVKLTRCEARGSAVIIGIRGPGSLAGSTAALLGEPHAATAQALIECRTRRIPAEEFVRKVKNDPELSSHIHYLAGRVRHESARRIAVLGGLTAKRRLEQALADSVECHGEQPVLAPPPFKHADLAAWLAITPEHLSRLLRTLEDDGTIRRDRASLVVLRSKTADDTSISRGR